ncbi:MAG: N-formylglutamate amidohydrolase [Devosia sp.]
MTQEFVVSKHHPGVLWRMDPPGACAPIVFDIPRSGADYPRHFRPSARFDAVHRSISMYLEELYADAPAAGAQLLYATFPNAFIDANRHELDIDADLIDGAWPQALEPTQKSALGIGLIHSVCGTGDVPLYDAKLSVADVKNRIEAYYWPYHNELAGLLKHHRDTHGLAYHISCHSMASIGGQATVDAGTARSQVDIGDRNGATCEPGFVEVVRETMRNLGYEVTHNKHYAGAEAIRKHADPANGIHSLQIELNRALYMDEETFQRGETFDKLREDLASLARAIVAYARARVSETGARTVA